MIKTTIRNDGTLHEETLEMAVKKFADKLPYWSKYLAEKILSGNTISDKDIDTSYSYLLEELNLIPKTDKPEISISYNSANSKNYKIDLIFTKLENVEGVNALVENQPIDFCHNMTIIYGENGAGKSGYVRLLKKAFSSKSPEDILPNVYLENGHKPISAKFTFNSNSKDITILYSEKEANPEFEQLAVFDGKSVSQHLSEKNEFEFRPAGLSFFTEYTEAIKAVEQILNEEIASKQTENNFALLFDGESEIRTIVENLSDQTNIEDIKKYTPFSEKDRMEKEKIEKEYDELVLASKGNKKEIQNLENIRGLLDKNKSAIENLNKYFSNEYLTQINIAITDCVSKEGTAKAKGIEIFKTKKIEGIGTTEWKEFITAAAAFANKQKAENKEYPEHGDNCLFCHQSLSDESHKLIANYWLFIKSIEEENVKKAKESLEDIKQKFEKLNFDMFPDDNILTVWLYEKYPSILASLQQTLSEQKTLASDVVSDIEAKTANKRIEIKTALLTF